MIVITAGHVDHGKTSLIKQLTGIDTDRLEEEKRRGLSIDLGFAYHKLPGHSPIGFIDVPGHNRFINTMIAGVRGIDLALLVVAADDGPMPQTREHLDILNLLGVQHVVPVISKTDRVSAQRVQAVAAEVRALLPPAPVPRAVFPVSNTSGEGITALLSRLEQAARERAARRDPAHNAAGGFRLAIDRAFNLKGVGLVVTGTTTAGSVKVGDTLHLQPADKSLRVRSIHVHDEPADTALAGQRCALNLVGDASRHDVSRGDWLLDEAAGPLSPSIDTRVQILATAPFGLRHLSPLKLYLGARRVAARLFILDQRQRLQPGDNALAQLLLAEPVSCCHGERILLRDDSESVTLGAALILDPYAQRKGKNQQQRFDRLLALETGSAEKALLELIVKQQRVIDLEQFRQSWNLRGDELASVSLPALQFFTDSGRRLAVSRQSWQELMACLPQGLKAWHRRNPRALGLAVDKLARELELDLEPPLLNALLGELREAAVISLESGRVCLQGHKVVLDAEELGHWQQIDNLLSRRGSDIPRLSELQQETGLRKKKLQRVLWLAAREGDIHRISDNRYARPQQLAQLAQLLLDMAAGHEALTVVNCKGRMGSGRKLTIEVLEYFDSIGFTRREEDIRIIVDPELPAQLFSR